MRRSLMSGSSLENEPKSHASASATERPPDPDCRGAPRAAAGEVGALGDWDEAPRSERRSRLGTTARPRPRSARYGPRGPPGDGLRSASYGLTRMRKGSPDEPS